MCRTKGFTLIETLVVAAMVSVVALALYSTFNSGIKIWQRLSKAAPDEDLNIFFEKISCDLRNSFRFSEIKFVGKKDSVSFATLVLTENEQKQKGALSIGAVKYYFDQPTETLNRSQSNYRQIYQNKSGPSRQMVNNVQSLRFQYYYVTEQQAYLWKDIWEEEKEERLPLAIRIMLESGEDAEREKITKTFAIPVAEYPFKKQP